MNDLGANKIRFLVLTIFVFVSCTAPPQHTATPIDPSLTTTSTPVSTPRLTNTPIPTSTSISGFEDWLVFNPQAVVVSTEGDLLILTLQRRALWFMTQRGILIYQSVRGNFKITAEVHAMKSSNPLEAPGGDGSVQLGGLMAHDGTGGPENYVFIVLGDDGNGLSIETKNTLDSVSSYDGPGWDFWRSGIAFMQIQLNLQFIQKAYQNN